MRYPGCLLMNNELEKKIVPKLRFPEFRDNEEWKEKTLGNIVEKVGSGTTPHGGETNYIKSGRPFVRSQNVGWGIFLLEDIVFISEELHQGSISTEIKTGDVLLNITGASIGRSAVVNNSVDGGNVNQHVCIIRTIKSKMSPYFLNQYLISKYGQNQIESFQAGGNRQGLNFAQIRSFLIPFPSTLKEQQKIAHCLSSLDELISAENSRLEALQAHKKGLMQQLFPAEGETVPELRFPEFRDSGEWKEATLGSAARFINGRAYKQEELLENGKYRVLRVGNFFTNKEWYYSNLELEADKYCEDGDLLYAWSASFGPKIWSGEKVIYHYHIWKVEQNFKIDRSFLYILLDYETERMKSQSNGFALLHITKGTIENWKCHFPFSKDEQKKIANCLSSLDKLITTQTEKIETLKLHKKGLMQGLFPAIN